MTELALEFISALAMPPPQFVRLARELGVDRISPGCASAKTICRFVNFLPQFRRIASWDLKYPCWQKRRPERASKACSAPASMPAGHCCRKRPEGHLPYFRVRGGRLDWTRSTALAFQASANSIMTLADCGVPAILRPSITSSNGSRWLMMDAILSLRRGMALTTSGISVG